MFRNNSIKFTYFSLFIKLKFKKPFQEVRKGSSNLDLLAEIALNQVSTTPSPPIEESSTRVATENIQISNPLLDLSTKQQVQSLY